MIEIVNFKNDIICFEYDFAIDRRTPVGNPFFMKSEKYRNNVCNDYDKWFDKQLIDGNIKFKEYLQKIKTAYIQFGKVRLFCWCAPKRCHGETIKKFLMGDKYEK